MNEEKKCGQIPKVIHYCWFGGNKKSSLIEKCIASWKHNCPSYEIKEWNETNFDISCCDYVKEAYQARKWAFVSDYARLWIVYHEGGIYLDTDVEIVKSLDNLLSYSLFLASEDDYNINTGIGFGAVKENKVIESLIESYRDIYFVTNHGEYDETPCTTRNTVTVESILGNVHDILNKIDVNGTVILSKEYFCPFNHITGDLNISSDKTYGIHWFNASWRSKTINIREKMLRPIKRLMSSVNCKH